jgi:beta-ureidopropionase / N-carbamoyl-L-amino-acid hydrolase
MQIDLERMQRRLAALTTPALGGTPAGGMNRLALTDTDRDARDLFVTWLREERLEPRVDDFGNIYGRRAGTDAALPPVLVGSHLDTVPGGGRFDGIVGVVAALEVASVLNEARLTTRHPLDIVNWTNEEGARFTPAMLASGAVTGVFAREWVYARADRHGLTFGDELNRIGYLGDESARPSTIAASLELHIEQGPILEAGGESVGIVEGVVGIRWCTVTVRGQSAHAGPTPMDVRHDAMVAAARMIVAARDLARERGDINATVGNLTPEPGVVNVIPPTVTFSLDLRGRVDATLEAVVADNLRASFDTIAREEGVTYDLVVDWSVPPTPFAAAIKDRAEALCRERGYSARRLWAGAGHDSQYLARVTQAAMIFTPTIGGLSHCETEDAPWPDIAKATDIMLALAVELANG